VVPATASRRATALIVASCNYRALLVFGACRSPVALCEEIRKSVQITQVSKPASNEMHWPAGLAERRVRVVPIAHNGRVEPVTCGQSDGLGG
jgi:hypothetical protein